MNITVENITPVRAKELLESNVNNRRLRAQWVHDYEREMTEGRWQFNAAPILIDTEGRILDGQHRLSAIIASKTTQKFVVVTGLDPATFSTIDIGHKRRASDAVQVSGILDHNHVAIASLANGIFTYCGVRSPSVPRIERFVREYGGDLVKAYELARPAGHKYKVTKVMGVAAYLAREVDPFAAEEFFTSLATGKDQTVRLGDGTVRSLALEDDDPRQALGRLFVRAGKEFNVGLVDPAVMRGRVANIARAWNLWRDGKTRSSLQFQRKGEIPIFR